jgi:hypothetical protein
VPITYVCNAALGCTFTRWDGDITPDDWEAYLDRLTADPAFPPGPFMIVDLRGANTTLITLRDIDGFAARWRGISNGLPDLRVAIVPSEAREQAEYFAEQVQLPNLRIGIFNQVAAACAWLEVDQDAVKAALQRLREDAN